MAESETSEIHFYTVSEGFLYGRAVPPPMSNESETVWLVIGIKPCDAWPLVEEGRAFNGEPEAWTVYADETRARDKAEELQRSDEHVAEWTVVPRRVE